MVAVPLSTEDLDEARSEVAAGRAFTVWFTPAAVGVPAGGSARVVSVGDPSDGDFIQVKPAGSRDTMFCAPGELTRARPARKKAAKPAAPVPEPAPQPEPEPVVEQVTVPSPAPVAPPAAVPNPRRPAPTPAPSPAPEPPPAPVRRPAARAAAGVTVTLSATAEGEWSVEVVVGKKRTVRPTPVSAGEVAKAARALPDEVAEAIESSLDAARQRQVDRVEQLRAELEAAQRALQDLTG